jgi:excisionase family DNA binding protein
MRSTNDPVFLTTSQAAERYKVSVATIRRWSRLGKIPARKIGRKYHINTEALDAVLGRVAS